MKIDYEKLNAGLEGLTGYDFDRAEEEERKAGNNAIELITMKSFQARLASIALDVPLPEIKKLPLTEYWRVTLAVTNFLSQGLMQGALPPVSTGGLQSAAPNSEGQNSGSDARRKA